MSCDHKFIEIEQGTTIKGEHFHLYKCLNCGLFDIGLEVADKVLSGKIIKSK